MAEQGGNGNGSKANGMVIDHKKHKSVFVAIPMHDGKMHGPTALSIIGATSSIAPISIKYTFHAVMGCPYITKARNDAVRDFLKSDCDEMVFIDSDVVFPSWALQTLIVEDMELVAGIYPKKTEQIEWPTMLKLQDDVSCIFSDVDEQGNPCGLLEATGLPTGFMKIKRSVFEKMMKAYPDLHYIDPLTQLKTFDFFGEVMFNGNKQWDDYSFCSRWAAIGGKMWVAPNINFGHIGNKEYKGNFWDFIMSRQGTLEQETEARKELEEAINGNP